MKGTATVGVKITKKPRCNRCGNVMRELFYRTPKEEDPLRHPTRLTNRWYCPYCDRIFKEE
jgi:uncharacterized protein with PIN domain